MKNEINECVSVGEWCEFCKLKGKCRATRIREEKEKISEAKKAAEE